MIVSCCLLFWLLFIERSLPPGLCSWLSSMFLLEVLMLRGVCRLLLVVCVVLFVARCFWFVGYLLLLVVRDVCVC